MNHQHSGADLTLQDSRGNDILQLEPSPPWSPPKMQRSHSIQPQTQSHVESWTSETPAARLQRIELVAQLWWNLLHHTPSASNHERQVLLLCARVLTDFCPQLEHALPKPQDALPRAPSLPPTHCLPGMMLYLQSLHTMAVTQTTYVKERHELSERVFPGLDMDHSNSIIQTAEDETERWVQWAGHHGQATQAVTPTHGATVATEATYSAVPSTTPGSVQSNEFSPEQVALYMQDLEQRQQEKEQQQRLFSPFRQHNKEIGEPIVAAATGVAPSSAAKSFESNGKEVKKIRDVSRNTSPTDVLMFPQQSPTQSPKATPGLSSQVGAAAVSFQAHAAYGPAVAHSQAVMASSLTLHPSPTIRKTREQRALPLSQDRKAAKLSIASQAVAVNYDQNGRSNSGSSSVYSNSSAGSASTAKQSNTTHSHVAMLKHDAGDGKDSMVQGKIQEHRNQVELAQHLLVHLYHAKTCTVDHFGASGSKLPPAVCSVTKNCHSAKLLWYHVAGCRSNINGLTASKCAGCSTVPYCIEANSALSHWKQCKRTDCAICRIVMIKIEQLAHAAAVNAAANATKGLLSAVASSTSPIQIHKRKPPPELQTQQLAAKNTGRVTPSSPHVSFGAESRKPPPGALLVRGKPRQNPSVSPLASKSKETTGKQSAGQSASDVQSPRARRLHARSSVYQRDAAIDGAATARQTKIKASNHRSFPLCSSGVQSPTTLISKGKKPTAKLVKPTAVGPPAALDRSASVPFASASPMRRPLSCLTRAMSLPSTYARSPFLIARTISLPTDAKVSFGMSARSTFRAPTNTVRRGPLKKRKMSIQLKPGESTDV